MTLLSIDSWLFKKRDPYFMVYEAIPTYLGSIPLDTHAGLPHHSWHPKMETFVLHHEWNEPRSLGKTSVNAKSKKIMCFFNNERCQASGNVTKYV